MPQGVRRSHAFTSSALSSASGPMAASDDLITAVVRIRNTDDCGLDDVRVRV